MQRGVPPHDARVLPGVPEHIVEEADAPVRDEPEQVQGLPLPRQVPREEER